MNWLDRGYSVNGRVWKRSDRLPNEILTRNKTQVTYILSFLTEHCGLKGNLRKLREIRTMFPGFVPSRMTRLSIFSLNAMGYNVFGIGDNQESVTPENLCWVPKQSR